MKKPPPRLRRFAEGQASLPNVSVFTTGVQRGKPYSEQDLKDMVANFNKFSVGPKALVRVPAVLGHEETQEFLDRSDQPAAAWANAIRVQNSEGKDGVTRPTLFVDFEELPPKVKRLLKGKAYRTVSAEIYDEPPDGVPGKGKMLRRVAFLGGDIPQVKSLDDIPEPVEHSESGARYTPVVLKFREARPTSRKTFWCFSEATNMDRAAMVAELVKMGVDQALITDAVPDPVLSEWLRTCADKGVSDNDDDTGPDKKVTDADKLADGEPPPKPTDAETAKTFRAYANACAKKFGADGDAAIDPELKKEMTALVEKYGSNSLKKFAQSKQEKAMMASIREEDPHGDYHPSQDQHREKPMKLSEIRQMIRQELRTGTGQDIAALNKFREQTLADTKRARVEAFCEAQKVKGTLTPALLDSKEASNVFDELMRLNATDVIHKFTENGKTIHATALDLRMRQIDRGPILVKYGERTKAGEQVGGSADGETEKVVAHFEKFSEKYTKLGQTKEGFTKAFTAECKRRPGLTADEYLTV